MGLGRGIRIFWVDILGGRWEGEIDDVDGGVGFSLRTGTLGESKEIWLDFR